MISKLNAFREMDLKCVRVKVQIHPRDEVMHQIRYSLQSHYLISHIWKNVGGAISNESSKMPGTVYETLRNIGVKE